MLSHDKESVVIFEESMSAWSNREYSLWDLEYVDQVLASVEGRRRFGACHRRDYCRTWI